MGITRNMIRRYEKKGVISKNENGKDREFDENDLIQLWNIRVMVSLGFSLNDVINVNLKMYSFDHLRMYIFAILPLDRYIFLSDKIFL